MLGELLALGCALAWALAVIFFRRSEAVSPAAINLFKNVLSVALLSLTLALLGQGLDLARPAGDWWRLGVSGIVGITVSDTVFFMALRRLGPGLVAVVDCSYAPVVTLMAVLFLGERPGPALLAGGLLVVLGILVVSLDRPFTLPGEDARARRGRAVGVLLATLAIVLLGVAIVVAKPVFERSGLVEVTLVRQLFAVAAQLAWILPSRERRPALAVLRPQPVWRMLVPASVLGSWLSVLLWIGGFKYADAGTASVLNQLSTVFILVLSRLFLGERLTGRRLVGAGAAFAGAVVVLIG